ncbi:MaoC family dehydratase [Hoeflea sp.]|uniref:MaoC family dehydratase n=1 Tax=Hoeflea sp. TaxID=1940281 RepID=UPI0019CB3B02|nr:MaoC family dehydratase [Hoeflea sp.]MBC7284237.1 MaoC family dehydratase [Hoeflea sp.]
MSCLASGLVEGASSSDGEYATWPLLAVPELVTALVGSQFRPEPKQVLVHESLFIECHRRPYEEERFSFSVSWSGAGTLGVDVELADDRGGKLAKLMAQLRWIDLSVLNRIKSISLTRAARGADLANSRTGIVTQSSIDVFVRLSGDPNPLHTDRDHALAAGLSGTVIPGAMLAALVAPALRIAHPGFEISTLSIRFLAPLISGRSIRISTSEMGADDGRRLRVFLSDEDDHVAAIGDVSAAA